jgi:uncharacterized protein YndB with AHSA1/START domain
MTIDPSPHREVVIEPRTGGRWFERAEDGTETDWGKVMAWDPPGRLLLAWQIDGSWAFDPAFVTELELTFAPEGTGTLVTLEHRNLERFGDSARKQADQLGSGWPGILRGYAQLAETSATD